MNENWQFVVVCFVIGQEQAGAVDQKQTFDISKFRRAAKNREAMPVKMKEMLSKSPRLRGPDENANVSVSCMKTC